MICKCSSHNSTRCHGELSASSAEWISGATRSKLRKSPTFRRTDVLVLSPDFRLSTGGPEGLLQPLGLLQACRKSSAADRAIPLIGTPSGSSDVASHDALDWEYFEPSDHHGPLLKFGDQFGRQAFLEGLGDTQGQIVSAQRGDLGLQQLEPELAKLRENGALLLDTLVVPTLDSVISPCRSAKARLTVGVHPSSPRRRLKTH